jgi:predicted O-methyltransferase YrrM
MNRQRHLGLSDLRRRARAKVVRTRPLPQLRILRAYDALSIRELRRTIRFALFDHETSNFTYDIGNRSELIEMLSAALDAPTTQIGAFVAEIDEDTDLIESLEAKLRSRRDANDRAFFGRRIGWYAAARWLKPRLTIETGTADGLGTAAIARALQRNAAEGISGKLLSFDIAPHAGWLLDEGLRDWARLVLGDVSETLPRELDGVTVDLFVHDSLHTYEHERFELEVVNAHAGEGFVAISDNAHATTALADFSAEVGMTYSFFRERPVEHFYPGAGLGIAVKDHE